MFFFFSLLVVYMERGLVAGDGNIGRLRMVAKWLFW